MDAPVGHASPLASVQAGAVDSYANSVFPRAAVIGSGRPLERCPRVGATPVGIGMVMMPAAASAAAASVQQASAVVASGELSPHPFATLPPFFAFPSP